ncbi:MAG: hypothetical protein WCQ96_03070 [Patescibacteria group bacterium]
MKTYTTRAINVSESGLIMRGAGKLNGIVVNSHSNGTIKIYDALEASAAATGTLTSIGACAPASHATSKLTSSGAMVAATHAVSVLTGTENFADEETVTVGETVYTMRDVLEEAYDVKIGATLEASLANLKKAINLTGTQGVTYGFGTVAHPDVVASASNATTLTVRGRVPGTSLNEVATTKKCDNASWADATLGGGTGASDAGVTGEAATVTIGDIAYMVVDELSQNYGAAPIAYQVKKGASEAIMLDNLKLAINGTGTAGTNYSTGTVAHPFVIATTNTNTTQVIVAREVGNDEFTAAINALETTETMDNTAWADSTLGGGTGDSNPAVTTEAATITIGSRVYTAVLELSENSGAAAVADQILWVTSEEVFLDNVKKALNGSGVAGTNYSTGTLPNYDVIATTNAADSQIIVSRNLGAAGNSVATTTTLANYAWGATTLASGSGDDGILLHDTITLAAGERNIDLYGTEFYTGLYMTIGGTADLTLSIN